MMLDQQTFAKIDESELWDLFREGNHVAYTQLLKKYSNSLFNYGYRICQDREFLMDCIQDVFYELWKRRDKISATPSVKWYLFKSIRTRIFHEQSKWNRVDELPGNYHFLVEFNIESKIIDDVDFFELSFKIKNIMNALPTRQREILYLRFYEGYDFDQIAGMMEINKQSVHNLLQKAYKNFRIEWVFFFLFHSIFFV